MTQGSIFVKPWACRQLFTTGDVKIEFYGHDAFKITSPAGLTVLVDPWRNDATGLSPKWFLNEFPAIRADIVLLTHAHFDHDAVERPNGLMVRERLVGQFRLGDVEVVGFADKHVCQSTPDAASTDDAKGSSSETCPPNNLIGLDNAIQIVETGGLRIAIWGDNRAILDPSLDHYLKNVDVLILPVVTVLTRAEVDAILRKYDPKAVIPVHYFLKGLTTDVSGLESPDEWIDEQEKAHPEDVRRLDSAELKLTAARLKGPITGYITSETTLKRNRESGRTQYRINREVDRKTMPKPSKSNKKELSPKQREQLLRALQARFQTNMTRHKGLEWGEVEAKLEDNTEKLWSLHEMEETGGEPDVVGHDKKTDEFIFYDCSAETPKDRRSLCYDREALESRKEHKPKDSATNMAAAMGIELLTEEQYRELQKLGEFDTKTSSWVKTPSNIRKLGGALFCDRRFDTVFTYHNGAESYYAGRGFRGLLRV